MMPAPITPPNRIAVYTHALYELVIAVVSSYFVSGNPPEMKSGPASKVPYKEHRPDKIIADRPVYNPAPVIWSARLPHNQGYTETVSGRLDKEIASCR